MDLPTLVQRQLEDGNTFVGPDGRVHYISFWYTRTGIIVKWVLFLTMLTTFTLYMTIGYWHAKKRVRQGLPPLAYHRWLISRSEQARVDPRYAYPPPGHYAPYRPHGGGGGGGGHQQEYYTLQASHQHHYSNSNSNNNNMMPPPPPMYDPRGRPPMYEEPPLPPPPAGATKLAPNQGAPPTYRPPHVEDEQPVYGGGPAPARLGPEATGSTNPYRSL